MASKKSKPKTKSEYDVIRPYFTEKEWTEISDYEKKRLRNIKENYEMMLQVGLVVSKPEFMNGPRGRKRKPKRIESDSEDEEWFPGCENARNTKKACFSAPFKPLQQRKTPTERKMKPKTIKQPSCTSTSKNESTPQQSRKRKGVMSLKQDTGSKTSSSRYPKRRCSTTRNYRELEAPDDDHYLYCEDCNLFFEGDCPTHPLQIIEDTAVPENFTSSRARASLPEGLRIAQSRIRNAGLGVICDKSFPKGVRFGPYAGEVVDAETGHDSGYAWQLFAVIATDETLRFPLPDILSKYCVRLHYHIL
ncbi:histone-lysine N-methyltransferase PRDM9-like [Glandiceps talaboti]